MRGHLRFRSERTPYRRAGLTFGETRQIELPATEMNGERLVILLADPALRSEAWDGAHYRPLPCFEGAGSASAFLTTLAQEIETPAREPAPAGDDLALQLATARDALEAANRTVEGLNKALEARDTRISKVEGELEEANREGDELAIHGQRAGELADFLEGREGFERGEGEHPASAAIRVIAGLDAAAAAEPGKEQQEAGGGVQSEPAPPPAPPKGSAAPKGKKKG